MTPEEREAINAQEDTPMFVCGDCGAPVIVYGGNTFRACEHFDAQVVAVLSQIAKVL